MRQVRDGVLGVIIGDMLGVPVEFYRREALDKDPVTGLRAGGSHAQPLGAWSDDSALTLCLAESLTQGFKLSVIAQSFVDWKLKQKWTSHGVVFDIGKQTFMALNNLQKILESGDFEALKHLGSESGERTNGNGSLMRTLPLYYHIQKEGVEQSFEKIWQVSALTHPHVRSALACTIYLMMLDELIKNETIKEAYIQTQIRMKAFFTENPVHNTEQETFSRIIEEDISTLTRDEIGSGAYVIDTLEASFWSLLNTNSYAEAVLRAVNLGNDTDTTGAVTGGMAGVFYGIDTAPKEWYEAVVKKGEIEGLCVKMVEDTL